MRVSHLVALSLLVPTALAAQTDESVARSAGSITADDVAHRVGIIAHDSMLGRTTPSPGLEMTAQYVADEFSSFGLAPGGDDGSYLQRYSLLWVKTDIANASVAVRGGPIWRIGTELANSGGSTGPEGVTGPVLVVSGTEGGSEALAELPIEGAVVVWVGGTTRSGGLHSNVRRLLRLAVGMEPAALIIASSPSEARWRMLLTRGSQPSLRKSWVQTSRAPTLQIKEATIAPMLAQHGVDLESAGAGSPIQGTPLPDLEITVKLPEMVEDEVSAPNTVGILEGSDPNLKDEYLVFSAHMDHVGQAGAPGALCGARAGDDICNGADDNASGTVAILELAQAFTQLESRPRRSIIFLTVSGEERGMWGSEYFATHPPVPVEQMVADLNADMVGRNWTDTISVIGKEHSDLGETLHRVAGEHPELNMIPVDDQWPDQRFYFRSDHIHFARNGVPILFFFNGTHEDYHRPSDEPEKIDAEKESRIAKLMFYLGLEIANADQRPQWYPESYAEIVRPGGTE